MKKLIGFGALALMAGCSGAGYQAGSEAGATGGGGRPWMNRALSPEKRAALLVAQMTLDEKILEVHMGEDKTHPREVAPVPRLGIPIFKITNGPAGAGPGDAKPTQPATALPSALGLSASWDPALAFRFGKIAGEEVADRGEDLLEGPGLNITRVPRNGRNFEYFGEDPYLSGKLGVAEVKGIQGERVIAEIKHYAANNQETDRKTINEIVDERTLREIYLPAFEETVKEADPAAVMAAYPSVNGHFCSESPYLLQDVLRDDWGFKGFVQSDYTGTRNAVRCANAGLDLAMKPDHYMGELKTAVESGQVSQATLDGLLIRRFTQMFKFGMFDKARAPKEIPAKTDGAAAREIAEQCAVLLKNEQGTLPLDAKRIRTIAVIGLYAKAAHTGGSGSSQVSPLYTVKPVEGIQKRVGPNVKVVFEDGADVNAAATAARSADVAIVMVGNRDSEGKDRPNLKLPNHQDALVAAVAEANPRAVVVLKTGGAVLMPWLEQVPAVLEAWYPGEEDGNVVAALLFGDVNPSGKLSMTFPKTEEQVPAHTPETYPGVNGVVRYEEKLEVGYRWYDAQHETPLFPFGFGLSYTTFAFSDLKMSPVEADGTVKVSVEVKNTGKRAGAEVVQAYVADPVEAEEPPKQLRGFEKVMLKAGQSRRVTIMLDGRAFSIWDTGTHGWKRVAGRYEVMVGDSSRDLPMKGEVKVGAGGADAGTRRHGDAARE